MAGVNRLKGLWRTTLLCLLPSLVSGCSWHARRTSNAETVPSEHLTSTLLPQKPIATPPVNWTLFGAEQTNDCMAARRLIQNGVSPYATAVDSDPVVD